MTDLLRYPVFALSPSGVDVYQSETDLVTCHRRAVKTTYEKLRLIDMDRDQVEVLKYRVHPLPPRRLENGRLNSDNVRVEMFLSPPTRLSLSEVRGALLETLRDSAGEEFDESDETVQRVIAARGMKELSDALVGAEV